MGMHITKDHALQSRRDRTRKNAGRGYPAGKARSLLTMQKRAAGKISRKKEYVYLEHA